MTMGKIVAIHASCEDLKFLRPIKKRLSDWAGNETSWHLLNSPTSHGPAKHDLEQTQSGLGIILLHGRSDGFRGGDYAMSLHDDSPTMFLNKGEMAVFQGKAIFCLSCQGNKHAEESIQKGARVFLGFDDVPFYRFDPITHQEIPLHSLTKHCQGLIFTALSAALERLICRGESFDEIASFLELWVRAKAVEFVRQNQSEQHRNDVAHLFLKMADTIRVSGNGRLRFRDLT
ncbi:hypothetical protein OAG63_00605 [Methylacidiphilales bacterium]|nr:hypothetical protein [Candidatus Methylacidiphilales bacterium]